MASVFLFLGTFLHLWGPLRLPSRATDTDRSGVRIWFTRSPPFALPSAKMGPVSAITDEAPAVSRSFQDGEPARPDNPTVPSKSFKMWNKQRPMDS